LKLLPAQFFLPYEQDFPTGIAGNPVFLLLELENPANMAGKIELEVISSHFGRNVFSVYKIFRNTSSPHDFVLHICTRFYFSEQ
jgi:hypothetical protein